MFCNGSFLLAEFLPQARGDVTPPSGNHCQALEAVKRYKAQSLFYQLGLQWTHHSSGGLQSKYPPYLPISLYF